MKPRKHALNYLLLLIIFGALITINSVHAQEIKSAAVDTAAKKPETIKISDISIRSSQLVSQTNRVFASLLSDEDIEKIGRRNDSIASLIDSNLIADKSVDLENMGFRQLNNNLNFWKQISGIVNQEEIALSGKIETIDKERFKLTQESAIWKNTRDALPKDDSFASILARVNEILDYLQSIESQMNKKSEKLLLMLDRVSGLDFEITEYLEKIDQTKIKQESKIFARHHNTLFAISWGNQDNWELKQYAKAYYQDEFNHLFRYLRLNRSKVILFLLLIGLLVVAFRNLKKRVIDKGIKQNSFTGRQMGKIFSRPEIVAIILGLFSSVLFFPDRPEILSEIDRILILFPLIYIYNILLDRHLTKQLMLFGIIGLLQTTIYIFPPDHVVYRMLVLLLAATEMGLFWSLAKHFTKSPLGEPTLNRYLLLILVFNIFIPFIGVIGVFTGATMLADEAVSAPFFSIFAAMLLIVSAICIEGLIEIGIDSAGGKKMNVIRLHGKAIKKRLIRIINILAAVYWIFVFLRIIQLDRVVMEGLNSVVKNEITIGSANFTLGNVLAFIIVIWLSVILSRFLQIVLEKDVLNKFKLSKGVPYTVGLMVRYAIITVGVFLAVTAAGLPIGSLGILIGAFGVGIGFGLQNIFNNLVSGLILLFERPIQLGDTVEVGNLIGKVKSIGIRSSNVRTFEGAEVIVPNGHFISNEVVNWTLSDHRRRIEVLAGVAYGSDPHLVKKLLLEGLRKNPDIIDDPSPEVLFQELGESSLNFRILFWTENIGEWLRIQSEVVFMVHDVLKENGIQIPFPQRDLHIKSLGPEVDGVIQKKNQDKRDEG